MPRTTEPNIAMFPLPLTCFEEYMLCDDRPAQPMMGVFRIRFSGFLDRDAFESALARAIERHPLLRATVSRKRRGRPRWIDHPDWRPNVQWQAEANEYGFPHVVHVDVTQDPGTRVWVLDRDDGHDVIIQAHHCCADALGMTMVFEDLLIGYALNLGMAADGVSLMELEPRRLLQRGTPGLTTWRFLKMAHKQAVGLLGVREFLTRSPVPLAGPVGEIFRTSPPSVFPAPRTHEFTANETTWILATAKSHGVTLNDLLIRDLFLAEGAWRKKWSIGTDRDWLRFTIPMNLRSAAHKRMPMTNSISMVFLDRQPHDFADPERLLHGIQKQMGRIKRMRLQYTFILSLAVSRLLPGGMSRRARSNTCQSTSCLSNLGPVLAQTPLPRRGGRIVLGNIVLESVDYVIPLRPHLNAAFCVYTYAGRLRVLMHFDPRAITDEQSKGLLETYIQQIRQTIRSGDRRS